MSQNRVQSFEWDLVQALNNHFKGKGIQAKAYRLKQTMYISQNLDILSDSADQKYYLGIECKSVNALKYKKVYFSTYFSVSRGIHQLDRIATFLEETGRKGYLAVELRLGGGRKREAYLLDFKDVYDKYKSGVIGLGLDDIRKGIPLLRNGKGYEVQRI
jgi:hypothetical protein